MRKAVVKALGEAGTPWVLTFEGTTELVPDSKAYKRKSQALVAAEDFNLFEVEPSVQVHDTEALSLDPEVTE